MENIREVKLEERCYRTNERSVAVRSVSWVAPCWEENSFCFIAKWVVELSQVKEKNWHRTRGEIEPHVPRKMLPPECRVKKLPQNEKEVFLLPLLPQLVFIAFCVEGFTDITLIDYGLPKFCEVRSTKWKNCLKNPWYYRQRLPVKTSTVD